VRSVTSTLSPPLYSPDGFNSQKTTGSESTQLIIDDVILFRP
jgi:hypothetical protein